MSVNASFGHVIVPLTKQLSVLVFAGEYKKNNAENRVMHSSFMYYVTYNCDGGLDDHWSFLLSCTTVVVHNRDLPCFLVIRNRHTPIHRFQSHPQLQKKP